ncbi:MAG TPA: hypothetical protein G4O08_05660 [Anaerolineae bacterium]|nr:hypothetical protein [Anaerolineae bacterium]
MDIPTTLELIGKGIAAIIMLILAFYVLKVVLKSTLRLLRFGCLIAIAGFALIWWLG